MYEHVIEITTEVFHLLQTRAPGYVSWSDEKPGATQQIVVEDDVYREFIDRAIAKRKTLDQVVREACTKKREGRTAIRLRSFDRLRMTDRAGSGTLNGEP